MTLLVNRYDYKAIKRTSVEGQRLYTTPAGDRVPSVTTILTATKPQEAKESLNRWRDAVGHKNAQQITTQAANRGTRMHTLLEHYVRHGELPPRPSNPFARASYSMAEHMVREGFKQVNEVWAIEAGLYYPGIYAGTTDSVGVHDDAESIMDYKQSNKPKKKEWVEDYFLQLAAYAEAHNEMFGTRIRKGVVMMMVKPETDQDGIVLLTEDGSPRTPPQYQEFILQGDEFEKYRQQWWHRLEQYYLQL